MEWTDFQLQGKKKNNKPDNHLINLLALLVRT